MRLPDDEPEPHKPLNYAQERHHEPTGAGRLEINTVDARAKKVPQSASTGKYFEIRVKGHLGSKWSDWLEGLEVRLLDDGETILFGQIVDQAALMGILEKLHRLNLTLLSISEVNHTE